MQDVTQRGGTKRSVVVALGFILCGALSVWAGGVAGNLDTGFDADGVVLVANGGGHIPCVGRQSSGKLVLAGSENGPNVNGTTRSFWRIQRRNADGSLDSSFGTSGEVELFGDHGTDRLRQVAVDGSNRILCVGSVRHEVVTGNGKKKKYTYPRFLTVVRLLADGALDTNFGDGGIVSLELPGASGGAGQAEAVHALATGALLVAGQAFSVAGASSGGGGKGKKGGGGSTSSSDAIALLKLTSGGALDTSFGANGITVHDASTGDDEPWPGALGVQSTGRIIIGSVARDIDEQWALTAYDSDGTVDTNFGRVVEADAFLRGLAIDASDRILACGYEAVTSGVYDFVLARYASNGSIDTSFGSSGTASLGLSEDSEGGQVLVQPDGKIVAALNIVNASGYWRTQPVRFTSGGALDTGFGTSGFGDAIQASGEYFGLFVGGLIDPNGDIVLAGSHAAGSAADWLLARWCGG